MKYLDYHVYCSGRSGLSNLIMSIEIGVVLAFLMDRRLILEGNTPPTANVVDYHGEIPGPSRSRVTDLLEIPIPWLPAEDVDLSRHEAVELLDRPLGECVFYAPPHLDTTAFDFRSFARGRTTFVSADGPHRDAAVVRLSGGPPVGPQGFRLRNLVFYSYFFYLDDPAREAVHGLLRRMAPRRPFAELAERVAADLGEFNAVHVRRGDFKRTFGVTTLDRKPHEVIEALEPHFDREDPLLILTDEMDDPFFAEILRHYRHALFADRFILDRHRDAFLDLPRADPTALAFLTQLVAAESRDFVGTMTSTFTSLIQRYRGNRGRRERFKFLWNEIPDEGVELERGRHPRSDCVPLHDGVMIEELLGPYSWNRVSPRVNPAWMREWPESFLVAEPADEAERG